MRVAPGEALGVEALADQTLRALGHLLRERLLTRIRRLFAELRAVALLPGVAQQLREGDVADPAHVVELLQGLEGHVVTGAVDAVSAAARLVDLARRPAVHALVEQLRGRGVDEGQHADALPTPLLEALRVVLAVDRDELPLLRIWRRRLGFVAGAAPREDAQGQQERGRKAHGDLVVGSKGAGPRGRLSTG